MNEELREIETTEEIVEGVAETTKSGKGKIAKMIAVGVLLTGGIGLILYKNKDKITERRIRKLEKEGYVVYKPEVEDDIDSYSEEVE